MACLHEMELNEKDCSTDFLGNVEPNPSEEPLTKVLNLDSKFILPKSSQNNNNAF